MGRVRTGYDCIFELKAPRWGMPLLSGKINILHLMILKIYTVVYKIDIKLKKRKSTNFKLYFTENFIKN